MRHFSARHVLTQLDSEVNDGKWRTISLPSESTPHRHSLSDQAVLRSATFGLIPFTAFVMEKEGNLTAMEGNSMVHSASQNCGLHAPGDFIAALTFLTAKEV